MYQLILHHPYRKGPYAIDISGGENDGLVTAAGYLDHASSPGSGALTFKSPHARVRVPPKPVWNHLFALQIEIIVRVDAFGQRRNLVEGADSFAFFIDELGRPWGTFNAPQHKGGAPTWHGASSATHSPDGVKHTVPIGRWTTLRFEHDGYASLRIVMDGKLIAGNYSLVSGIPPVTAAGVTIGNWTIADQYQLDGAVDDLKIWRYDPDDGLGHFLCRELDAQSAPCWAFQFDWLAELLRNSDTRERVIRLINCVAAAQTEVLRQIRAKGESAIAENSKLAKEYRKLWCDAPIDSRKMKDWQKQFITFLVNTIGQAPLDAILKQVEQCYLNSELADYAPTYIDLARCDPQFIGYIEGFIAALGHQPKSGEYR
jgi:hypothetical protein